VTRLGRQSTRRALCAAVVAALAALAPHAGVGATGPDVTACVERNLPRYSNPGSAVVAQYSDLETLCQDLIEDGASVDFQPSGGGEGPSSGSRGSASPPSSPAAPEDSLDNGAAATAPESRAPAPAEQPPRKPSRDTRRATGASERAGSPSSARQVAAAVRESGAAPRSPFPSSVSDGALWLYVILGGAAAAIAGAATVAVRRRR